MYCFSGYLFESVPADILYGVQGERLVYTKLRGGKVQTGLKALLAVLVWNERLEML